MPTVIDELITTLHLDASKFQQGQKDTSLALKKMRDESAVVAKQMSDSGKRAAEMFSAVKVEALSLIGVLLGGKGIESIVKDTATGLTALGRQAMMIGENAGAVQAFAMAISRVGGNSDSAIGALRKLAQAKADFETGKSADYAIQMNMIGGNAQTTPLEAMKLFQAYIEKHKGEAGGVQKIDAINRAVFGLDDATLTSMLKIGTVANLMKELGESYANGVPSDGDIKKMEDLYHSVESLGQAAQTTGRNLAVDLAPGLTAAADATREYFNADKERAEWMMGAIISLGGMKVAPWILRLLGLTTAATITAPLALSGDTVAPSSSDAANADTFSHSWFGSDGPIARWFSGPKLAPDVEAEVRRQAALHGLDPDHMARLAQKEGGGYDNVSPAGAFGPMQLMPDTAAEVGVRKGGPWQDNVRGGMDYYAKLLAKFNGNYPAADAAYNAGPNNKGVLNFLNTGDPSGLPNETKDYIRSINGASRPAAPMSRLTGNNTQVNVGTLNVNAPSANPQSLGDSMVNRLHQIANTGAN